MTAGRRPPLALAGALAALLGFGALAARVLHNPTPAVDLRLFRALYAGEWHGWPRPVATGDGPIRDVLPVLLRLSDERLAVAGTLVVALVLVLPGRRREAVFFGAAVAIAASSSLLKDWLDRPSEWVVPPPDSFPSGHAMASMAIAAALAAIARGTPLWWPAIVAGTAYVLLVATAAVGDGWHWPTDVLGGWLLALAWVLALSTLLFPRRPRAG